MTASVPLRLRRMRLAVQSVLLNVRDRRIIHARTMMFVIAAIATVAPVAAQQERDRPGRPVLADIRVVGNETIPRSAILAEIKSQPGREYVPEQVREDKRALSLTQWFYSVQDEITETPDGLVLVFSVIEKPIVRSVQFLGCKKVKEKYVRSWTGLERGSPFDPFANRQAVKRIEEEYKERGHAWVKVELQKGGEAKDRDVIIRIHEGPVVRVLRREVEGNNFQSDSILETRVQSKFAWFNLIGGIYKPEMLRVDEQALTDYYTSLGFFDVNVKAIPKFNEDRSRVIIVYRIDEGQRYKVNRLILTGNRTLQNRQLLADSELKPGDYFNARPLSKDVRRMLDMYGERGHYFATVNPTPSYTEQDGLIDVVFEIDEDIPRQVRDIQVQIVGERTHTKEFTLLTRFLREPGDLAVPELIERSRRRIASEGLFSDVDVKVIRVDPLNEFAGGGSGADGFSFRGQSHAAAADAVLNRTADQRYNRAADQRYSGHSMTAKPIPSEVAPSDGRKTTRASNAPADMSALMRSGHSLMPTPARTGRSSNADSDQVVAGSGLTGFQTVSPAGVFSPAGEKEWLHQHLPEAEDIVIRAQNREPPGYEAYQASPYANPYGTSIRPQEFGEVDVLLRASEAETGRFIIGAGVNSNAGIVGQIIWDESNFNLFKPPRSWEDILEGRAFRGGGQRLRLEAIPGDVVSRYSLQWTDPYFMYSDYNLSVSGSYFTRFYQEWDETRLGGRVGLGRQLDTDWSIGGAIRLEEVEVENPLTPTPAVITQAVGKNFLSTGRIFTAYDTRDSSLVPTTGTYGSASYEQAFGDFNYPRFELEMRRYFTVFSRPAGDGRQVLSLSGRVGFTGDNTPVFERFFAGGYQSFRGFDYRGVSPRIGASAVGGDFQLLGTAEYRLPVTADDMFQVVAFSDFGTVQQSVALDQFRVTAGVGLRVTVPQLSAVPLAFDFGFPIMSEGFDDERVFAFYVGVNR